MAKERVSTTVDVDLLRRARAIRPGTDASLLEAALTALLAAHRSAEIDAAYAAAYTGRPLHEPDAWGDLQAWRQAAARS